MSDDKQLRQCVVCGMLVPKPEPGVDYCSDKCFQKEREN